MNRIDTKRGPELEVLNQAVILTTGMGTRMAKDYNGPKHLLPVNGKPILEHTLENLPECIENVVFVMGGPHEQAIYRHFRQGTFGRLSLAFIKQSEPLGVAHAFQSAEPYVTSNKWLGLTGDDLYSANSLDRLVNAAKPTGVLSILSSRVKDPSSFGVLQLRRDDTLWHFEEKPTSPQSKRVWCGAFVWTECSLTCRSIWATGWTTRLWALSGETVLSMW